VRRGTGEADLDLTSVAIWSLAGLAALLCLWELSRSGMLFGVTEYDDAAYFGSAVRLVHGVLPYRDFYLVQPPGLVLLLTPLAWLSEAIGTRDALAVGRLCIPLVAAAQVLLVGRLVRHKGLAPTFVGCAVIALYTDAISSTHTIVLEPLLVLFCLGALALAFDNGHLRQDRRVFFAGLLLGASGAVKLFAIVPAAVLAVHYWRSWRSLGRLVAGAVAGFALLAGPFIVLAPSAFIHQVFAVQLHRQLLVRTPLNLRLSHMLGLSGFSSNYIGMTATAGVIVVVGVLLVAFVATGYVFAARDRAGLSQLDTFSLATSILVVVMFLVPAEFYYHYADLLGPFLALAIATATGGILTATRTATGTDGLSRTDSRSARALAVLAIVLVAGAAAGQLISSSQIDGADSARGVDAVVPAGACTVSDSPALLVTADRLVSSTPGCPQLVDALGLSLSIDTGASPAIVGTVTPQLVDTWLSIIGKADYVVLSSAADLRIPVAPAITNELRRDFSRHVEPGGVVVFVRHGSPVASSS
jgi:hypothetical protein